MADQKVTDLTEITSIASDDLLYVIDASDTTDGAGGSSKSIQAQNLLGFNWTTSEQVYLPAKDNGATLYAKKVATGAMPNTTSSTAAHGITGLASIFNAWVSITDGSFFLKLSNRPSADARFFIDSTNVNFVTTGAGLTSYSGFAYLIYTKS